VPASAPDAIVHQFCSAEKEIMVERRKLIRWLCPDIHTDFGGVSLPKQLQFLLEHIHPDFGGVSLRKQLRSTLYLSNHRKQVTAGLIQRNSFLLDLACLLSLGGNRHQRKISS
jgi:hypothetical protein